jgi:Spy/CpxP family protein refolding chaperone
MKLRPSLSMIALVLVAAAIGCGGSSPPAEGPSSSPPVGQAAQADVAKVGAGEEIDDSTADLAEHHRHHHHGGFAMFIAISLDTLNITPEQHDAITKIQSDMHAKMQPAHDAEKAVLLALADAVAAGQVDQPKLDTAVAKLGAASAQVHDAVIDSLNALHHALTPPQRQALVDKVEANYAVWHHANAPDETLQPGARGGHVAQLAKDLGLSPDQVEKIKTSYREKLTKAPKYDRAEADAHFKAFAEAFTADHFDAKSMTTGAVNSHMATWGITRLVLLYTAAAPILNPDQRAKAAEDLRAHANYKRTDSET